MRKVVLCVFALLAILFGAVLGVIYPPKSETRLIKNNKPLPYTRLTQTPSPSSARLIDGTEQNALSCPVCSDANGSSSLLPYEPPTTSSDSDKYPEKTGGVVLGQLVVDNQSVTIYSGIEEEILKNGPGWMPESALPGDDGMSVILGHRNRNHLKIIEEMQAGDEISFCYLDGRSVSYSVTDVQIFENSSDWVLPQPDGNMLVIVTCYPFRYSGSAPGKFQVVCRHEF